MSSSPSFSSSSAGSSAIPTIGPTLNNTSNPTSGAPPPMANNASPTTATTPKLSFYRRPLPSHLIQLSSEQGKAIFREALSAGFMEGFFSLSEHFHTQMDPSYCGLGTLTMVLNALLIDPDRLWRGSWRWFSEEMLDCCVPLDVVQTKGITMDQFRCLAQCNGAQALLFRATETIAQQQQQQQQQQPSTSPNSLVESQSQPQPHQTTQSASGCPLEGTEEHFRQCVRNCCQSSGDRILVVSYSRKTLSQTGSGHFSPIGGYHPGKDLVLIFDVARFKYPPHWCPLSLLWKAMLPLDPVTGLSRGYMIVSRANNSRGSLLCKVSVTRTANWDDIAPYIRTILPRVLSQHRPTDLAQLVTVIVQDVLLAESLPSIFKEGDFSRRHIPQMRAAIFGALTMYSRSLEMPPSSPTSGDVSPSPTAQQPSIEREQIISALLQELRELSLFSKIIKPTLTALSSTSTPSPSDVSTGIDRLHDFLHSPAAAELVTIIMLALPLESLRPVIVGNGTGDGVSECVQLPTQVIEELKSHQMQITQFSDLLRSEIEQLRDRMTAIAELACCFYDQQTQTQQNHSCSCCLRV